MLSPEKDVEQYAERIDVGRGRDWSAEYLLRSSEFGGQRASRFAREFGRLARFGFVLEQLGDAKIQQLHHTRARDEHIRWLYVPMDDQVCMRVRDGSENVEKQAQAACDVELRAVTMPIDAFALDKFQDQV